MIPVINDIDRLLQAAPSRYGQAYARSLQLSASARAFEIALDATVSPSAIVFIASRVGFSGGTVEFSTDNGTPLAVDGDVATLLPAAMMGSGCEVVATVTYQGEPHVARQSVTKQLAFDSSVPPAPTGLAAQGALASINLRWDPTNNTNIGAVQVWRALTNDLTAAAPIGETAGLARVFPDVIGAAGRFYYWIRYISKANIPGPFNAAAGTLGTTGIGAEHLLELLKDQISESQLLASLRARIDLAVAGSEVAGNVAAALQAETDARIAAIDKEIADRLAALRGEAAAREAYVQDYTYSKVETDGALSIQAQAIAAAFTSYADQAERDAVATAAADVRSYGYSKATADAAEAAQTNAITASYKTYADGRKDEALTAAAADVRTYSYSKAGTDSAISTLATTLRAEMASNGGVSEAYVKSYAYSKAEVNSSIAGQSSELTTAYKQYADARKTEAITAAAADVRTYAYSKSDTNGAIASSASELRAEFSNNNGATAAWVQEYAYSKAQADSAIASATTTLSSTVNGHTSSLQTQGTSIDGLKAQYTVKIDNNGFVTGYGLASSYVNGIPTSAFIINADRFAVVAPGLAPKVMFAVGQVNGQTAIGVDGQLIIDGSLTARNIVVSGYGDNLVPDPHMRDPIWWGRPNATYVNFEGADTPWRSHRVMQLSASNTGYGVLSDTSTPMFPIERGGWYKVDFQVYLSPDFNGYLTLAWHLPNKAWHQMGGPFCGYNWQPSEGGLPMMFDPGSPNKGVVQNFTATVYMEDSNVFLTRSQFRSVAKMFGGYAEVGGFKVTRVNDSSLIVDGAIKARHISVDNLRAIAAYIGGMEIGPGGHIRQGMSDYGVGVGFFVGEHQGVTKLILGDPNGAMMWWDGSQLQQRNVKNIVDETNKFRVTISGNLLQTVGDGPQNYGNLSAAASGVYQAPLTIRWGVDYGTANGTAANAYVSGSASAATTSFAGSATRERVYLGVFVQFVDAAGRVATAEYGRQITHGAFVLQ